MNEIKKVERPTWVIFHNKKDVFHLIEAFEGQRTSSGLTFMEIFYDKESALLRIKELNPTWVEKTLEA